MDCKNCSPWKIEGVQEKMCPRNSVFAGQNLMSVIHIPNIRDSLYESRRVRHEFRPCKEVPQPADPQNCRPTPRRSVLRTPVRQIIEAIKGLTWPPPTQEDIGWQPTDSAEIKD